MFTAFLVNHGSNTLLGHVTSRTTADAFEEASRLAIVAYGKLRKGSERSKNRRKRYNAKGESLQPGRSHFATAREYQRRNWSGRPRAKFPGAGSRSTALYHDLSRLQEGKLQIGREFQIDYACPVIGGAPEPRATRFLLEEVDEHHV